MIMKKLTILFSILIASVSAYAASTLQITLSSASQADKVLQIILDNPFSDAYDNGYDAVIGANQDGGLYICSGSERYSLWATNAIATNLPMGFGSVDDDEYTLSFQYFTGTAFEIYDRTADKTITVNSASNILIDGVAADPANKYTFTLGTGEAHNAAINDRFYFNYDPSALKYDITLNGQYLATFSAPENVIIPDGLSAYTAEFQGEQDYLLVSKITGNYIPKNTGVILFNPLGGKTSTQYDFSLVKYAGNVAPIQGTNELKPATAYPVEDGTVYVLHESEMWLYDGANMKPNKAFLHVQVGSGAPQRIRMVFNEEQGVENIAAEGKAVKFIENGRVFIKRGEKIYNVQGQLVK